MDMVYILVVAGGLQVGGAEKIAANLCKYAPQNEFCFHYIIFEGYENVYGAEIEKNGGRVFTLPSPKKNYAAYIKSLGRLIDQYQYKVVHSHTMFNSGLNLLVSKYHKVPIRIAHSHTTRTETKVSVLQRLYEKFMQFLICRYATDLLACGIEAGKWLYGERVFNKRGKVIQNAIDIESNAFDKSSRLVVRKKLGLEERFVIGHVGSLLKVKNQKYLISLMPEILKRKPNAVLLLLGGGEEEEYLKKMINSLKLHGKIILYGSTLEVNKLLNAFDVFAFPSTREGTPLALLEAQTNGLPCVVSSNIPQDAFLTDLIYPIPLEDKAAWVKMICTKERYNSEKYSYIMAKTGYNASSAYQIIYDIYRR